MSRASNLILFGILIVITPFTGLPVTVRTLLSVAFGACIIGIGVSLRAETARAMRFAAEPLPPAPEPETMVTPPAPPQHPSAI